MNITIRREQPEDYRKVEEITREAFWNLHFPGCSEHLLAHSLRSAPAFIPELDLVAVVDGEFAGNIMYCRAIVSSGKDAETEVLTFGPLSVSPALQSRGIGAALIRHSLALAKEMGFIAVFIYGDPDYYHRFGFAGAKAFDIRTADGYYMDALMGLELFPGALEGISGRFFEGEAYNVDDTALEEFEKGFPPKEKLETESQKHFLKMLNQREK
jgi:predicted N-acetyltransferase YhbS